MQKILNISIVVDTDKVHDELDCNGVEHLSRKVGLCITGLITGFMSIAANDFIGEEESLIAERMKEIKTIMGDVGLISNITDGHSANHSLGTMQ